MKDSHNSTLLKRAEEIKEILNDFCDSYLNEDYKVISNRLCEAIIEKDESLLIRGKSTAWACGIIHAIGSVNNLFNKDNDIYIKAKDLYENLQVSSSTGLNRSKQIQSLMNMSEEDNTTSAWRITKEENKEKLQEEEEIQKEEIDENFEKAQALIKEAWQYKNFNKKKKLAKEAIEICDYCVDAYIILAKDNSKSNEEKKELLEKAVKGSLKLLGVSDISEITKETWNLPEITSFLGSSYNLLFQLWNMGERRKAIDLGLEILKYDEKDMLMIRCTLVSFMILENNIDEAEAFLEKYKNDSLTSFKYSKVVVEYLKGNLEKSEEALKEAYKFNPYVIAYILNQKRLPETLPKIKSFRSEEAAVNYMTNGIEVWKNTNGLKKWVKEIYKRGL